MCLFNIIKYFLVCSNKPGEIGMVWERIHLIKTKALEKYQSFFASIIRLNNCFTHGKVTWAILGEVMLNKARLDLFHTRAWSCYGGSCGIHARKEAQQYNDMAFM